MRTAREDRPGERYAARERRYARLGGGLGNKSTPRYPRSGPSRSSWRLLPASDHRVEILAIEEQLAELADFDRSPRFTPAERAALRYAQEMCRTPVDVPDAVFEELKRYFDSGQIVELTAMVALENLRARFNRSLQIPSDSLCALPADHPVRKRAAAG